MVRWISFFAVFSLIGWTPGTSGKQQTSKRISVRLKDVTLDVALRRVCSAARVRYEFDPAIRQILSSTRVTCDFEETDFHAVVENLLTANWRKAPLRYTSRTSSTGVPRAIRVEAIAVSVRFDGEPLDKALQKVFSDLFVDFSFSPAAVGSHSVSMPQRVLPFTEVIVRLLDASEHREVLSLVYEDGVFLIVRKAWHPEVRGLQVCSRFSDCQMEAAVRALLKSVGRSYASTSLAGFSVTQAQSTGPFRSVFENALRNASSRLTEERLTYRVTGDAYVIYRKGPHIDVDELK